ncbi:hypothetical protein BJ944DRAFT_275381 [Cunninghamella echinulata]|nr:hypothetical protein BJ944DRAFT_275381 [Cunninghamella echinulata]
MNNDDQQSVNTAATYVPKTYPMAWIALFFLVFLRSAISIYNNTFNPIPTVTATYLNVDLTAINWLFNIQAVVYIIVSFGTSWLFETLGVKKSFATVWFTENKRATAGMFVILVAVIASVATAPQFFLPALPPKPSSPVEISQEDATNKISLWQGTLTLMKNVHFWILCGIHGINVGLSICWGGLFAQAVAPYGYTNSQAGNISAIGIVAGTLGCFIAGPVLDATKKHTLFLKMMAPLVCSTYIALVFIVSYPVPESISTSILWQIAQVIGFALVLVMDKFRDPRGRPANNMDRGLIFQAATSGVIVILSFIYSGKMLRTEAYAKKKEHSMSLNDDDNATVTDGSHLEIENFQHYDDITPALYESAVTTTDGSNHHHASYKPRFHRNDSNADTINVATEDSK